MKGQRLHIAWGKLMVLTLGSTLLSLPDIWEFTPVVAGIGVLVLAWLKARIVLSRYLGLASAPSWQRGFEISLALFCLLLLGLYLSPLYFA